MRPGSRSLAVARTCPRRLRPPIRCSTFGVADFIRVPWPAARTITAAGGVRLTRTTVAATASDVRRGTWCWCTGAARRPGLGSVAPPPGFEPGPHGTKGRRAAITPGRIARDRAYRRSARACDEQQCHEESGTGARSYVTLPGGARPRVHPPWPDTA